MEKASSRLNDSHFSITNKKDQSSSANNLHFSKLQYCNENNNTLSPSSNM